MKKAIHAIIRGNINSKELYNRLKEYEPLVENVCVTDIIISTFVSASVLIEEQDVEKIISICKEYGPCDVDVETLPIT